MLDLVSLSVQLASQLFKLEGSWQSPSSSFAQSSPSVLAHASMAMLPHLLCVPIVLAA